LDSTILKSFLAYSLIRLLFLTSKNDFKLFNPEKRKQKFVYVGVKENIMEVQ